MALPVIGAAAISSYIIGTSLAAIVFRVMALLGIGIITYAGSQELINQAETLIQGQLDDIDNSFEWMFNVLNIDRFISLILSAYSIRFTITASRSFIGLRAKS